MIYDHEFWKNFLDFFLIKDAITMICEHNNIKPAPTKKEMIDLLLESINGDITVEKIANLFPKEDLKIFSQEKEGRVSGTKADIIESVIKIFKARND